MLGSCYQCHLHKCPTPAGPSCFWGWGLPTPGSLYKALPTMEKVLKPTGGWRKGILESIGRNKKPYRTGRTEPNRLILEPAGTGRGTEPNRTRTSQDTSEKHRPNRVEPWEWIFRTEQNRTDDCLKKSPEPKRIEPNLETNWNDHHYRRLRRASASAAGTRLYYIILLYCIIS